MNVFNCFKGQTFSRQIPFSFDKLFHFGVYSGVASHLPQNFKKVSYPILQLDA